MSFLLREIKNKHKDAAKAFEVAGLRSDSDIQSLTREDLNELLPGPDKFKMRRDIYKIIIHKQKPIDLLLREMKGFIPEDSLRAALSSNGVLVDYLRLLKDMRSQMFNVQSFLDAQINLLEELRTGQPNPGPAPAGPVQLYSGEQGSCSDGNVPTSSGLVQCNSDRTPGRQDPGASGQFRQTGCHGKPPQVPLQYQTFVAGQTFGADAELMDRVRDSVKDWVLLSKGSQDPKVTFVFCPISSRIASDVEAAMADVRDDKPVILVLMHHSHSVKYTTPLRTWDEDKRVLLHVNVFYHETVHGLLKAEENYSAVSKIQNKILECFCQGSYNPSGNVVGVGAEGDQNSRNRLFLFWK